MTRPVHWMAGWLALLLAATGCSQRPNPPSEAVSQKVGNDMGLHGGVVAEIGSQASAEIVCKDRANLDIYFFDADKKTPIVVDDAMIEGYGVVSNEDARPARLRLARVKGDEANHFQSTIPSEWPGKRAAVIVPKVLIAGRRWHFDFEVDIPSDAPRIESPNPVANDKGLSIGRSPTKTE